MKKMFIVSIVAAADATLEIETAGVISSSTYVIF